jgi:xanthine dehydrogenase accessory factor
MDDLHIFEEIVEAKKNRSPAALAVVVATRGSSPRKAGAKMLVRADGTISGTIGGGATEAATIGAALQVMRSGIPRTIDFSLTEEHGHVCGGNVTVYLEPVTAAPPALIVGAGHVGRAVARAAEQAGFFVTLIDTAIDRPGAPVGDGVRRCAPDELAEVFQTLEADRGAYIFIATSDHQQDFVAAGAALKTEVCYIGVLGSTRKRAAMEQYLADAGYGAAAISRIISPAGIAIDAETPEEIAVSVVAQMIQQRRRNHGAHRSAAAGRGPL